MAVEDTLSFRDAAPDEWESVSALHVASWRSAYRGMLLDAYLDGAIAEERRALWRARLAGGTRPDQIVVVGEDGSGIVALACILAGQDRRWGSLIDNLHVRPDRKRGGIGRLALAEAARRLPPAYAGTPLHLTVLEANRAAQSAYENWGGALVERLEADLPDGQRLPVRRYAWATPAALTARLERRT
jgi:ribosomal protein S18 acetylase RimI-like enzyme